MIPHASVRPLVVCSVMLTIAFASAQVKATQLTGVVYSESSGPSGTGTGQLKLAVGDRIYRLDFQKPVREHFANATCREIGAIRTVTLMLDDKGGGSVLRWSCDGRVDSSIHPAWLTLSRYLKLLALRSYLPAYNLLSRRLKAEIEFSDFMARQQRLGFQGYLQYGGHGRCLIVESQRAAKSVNFVVSADCHLECEGEPCADLTFRVGFDRSTMHWEVAELPNAKPTEPRK
jgi:hypothetical protein